MLAVSSASATMAQSVSTRFEPREGVGVKIWADGNRLLVDDAGAGFYLIGSNDDTDDENNIASFVRNNNGVMRPMNGAPTPYLPYSFTFQRDPNNSNKLYFNISIGPSEFDFTTISFPLDGRQQLFTHWRHSGSSSLGRYDQNPYTYTPPGGGPIYIKFVPGNITWGEMIGPDYTVRITLTSSSRPNRGVAFVNAPSLSTGVRNVEFGFGPVGKGQRATASGFIQVFRTDPALLAQPPLTFQSESHPYHQIGRRDGDGWSVRVGDIPSRYMNYGPYTTSVAPGRRTATFRLMLDNTTADNNRILTVDVFDAAAGRILAIRSIRRREFTRGPFQYQDFDLSFTAATGQRLEFRTFWHGGSYVRQDYVRVR
jgi:hypothetical protein